MSKLEEYLDESVRGEFLDKMGVEKLKPRIDDVIDELDDISYDMNLSTNAKSYTKKFNKIILDLKKFYKNFKPKNPKPYDNSVIPK